MSKILKTEDALSRIREIRNAPESFDLPRDLAPFLHHKSNHVIAAAAKAIQNVEYAQLSGELSQAFLNLFPKASARDQGCKALLAIAEALVTKGEDAAEVYLAGIGYVQMEGSFGPPIDTAAPLRGVCARGLIRMRHPDSLYLALDTLTDKEPAARLGAVQAFADAGTREAELLLRLKIMMRDQTSEITGACFAALLEMAPARSLPFCVRFLQNGTREEVEAVALALGEARCPGALEPLKDAWSKHREPQIRRTLLLSIGMLRDSEAIEFLLTRLQQDSPAAIPGVFDALALYRHDEAVTARVRQIAGVRSLSLPSGIV